MSNIQSKNDNHDPSNGWDSIASKFIERRQNSHIGINTVTKWASELPSGSDVLDLGCGFGVPISNVLMNQGLNVYGIDASTELIQEFKRRFPSSNARCESVEDSDFYGKIFDSVIAIGLIFLLSPDTQIQVIAKVGKSLKKGGRFLFTSPYQICTWKDLLTGRDSISLGREAYLIALQRNGFTLIEEFSDDGGNHHFSAIKQ